MDRASLSPPPLPVSTDHVNTRWLAVSNSFPRCMMHSHDCSIMLVWNTPWWSFKGYTNFCISYIAYFPMYVGLLATLHYIIIWFLHSSPLRQDPFMKDITPDPAKGSFIALRPLGRDGVGRTSGFRCNCQCTDDAVCSGRVPLPIEISPTTINWVLVRQTRSVTCPHAGHFTERQTTWPTAGGSSYSLHSNLDKQFLCSQEVSKLQL